MRLKALYPLVLECCIGLWKKGASCWPMFSAIKQAAESQISGIYKQNLRETLNTYVWKDTWQVHHLIFLGSHTFNRDCHSQGKLLSEIVADVGLKLTPCVLSSSWQSQSLLFALTSSETALFVWPKFMCIMCLLFCEDLIAVQPNASLPSSKQAPFSPAHQWTWSEGIKACSK